MESTEVVHKMPVECTWSNGQPGSLKVGQLALYPVPLALRFIRQGWVRKLNREERLEKKEQLEALRVKSQ
jgi:hypothetical protein